MKHYTVGFVFDSTLEHVLLIHKNRPDWQKGKLNGPGGGIRSGETSEECMSREMKEETGLRIPPEKWIFVEETQGSNPVRFYCATHSQTQDAQTTTDERVEWVRLDALPSNLVPDLQRLIPLSREKIRTNKPLFENKKEHVVVATGIVIKDGKYLIAQRASHEKAFPNKWTVPGGKLEMNDYAGRPKDAGELWYNLVEDLVEREIKEEVNLEIHPTEYLTSMSYIRPDGIPCIILSMFAHYKGGEVKLCNALTNYAWVTLEEAKKYDLIDGILEELAMLDHYLHKKERTRWKPGMGRK